MADKYPIETRLFVIELWFLGLKLEDIANQVKVSLGSVRNFVDELRAGKYPEFEGLLPYLEGMRYTAQQMRANNLGLPQVVTGLNVFMALVRLGLDPGKLLELFRILERIAPGEFPQKDFVRALLRIAEIEKGTGLSFEQLEAKANQLRTEIPTLEAAKKGLDGEVASLKTSRADEKRALDKTIEAKKATLQLLERYEHDVKTLTLAGLAMEDVASLADFIRKARDVGYLNATVELARLEKQTGKNYTELLTDCKQAISLTDSAKQEFVRITGELGTLRDEIQKLRTERATELQTNKTTEEQLERNSTILKRLAAIGVDFERLDALQQLLSNIQNLGWKPRDVVAYLSAMSDLDAAKKTANTELAKVREAIEQGQSTLTSLNNQITVANDVRNTITITITKLKENLVKMAGEESEKKQHITLADNLLLLLRDPSKLSVEKVSALIFELLRILQAMMRPELHIFPLDFQPIRQKALEQWENVLGKQYVSKEFADTERKRLGDQNTDLMMDRLCKFEREKSMIEQGKVEVKQEKAEVKQAKDELVKMVKEAEQMTKEKALELVVGMEREGRVTLYTCTTCKSTMAICPGTSNQPKVCPCCATTIPLPNLRYSL